MTARRHLIATALAGATALLSALPASAEINGIINGRSVDPANLPDRSIDIGFHERDLDRQFGVRFNFGVNERITGFANAAIATGGPFDSEGYSFGGGAFIFLPNQRIWDYVDMAVKPTINYYSTQGDFDYDRNLFQIGADAVISSKEPIGNTQLSWYANAGLVVQQVDVAGSSGDTEVLPQIGGGAYLPVGNGQLFFGVDILDGNPDLGVGYRFFLG